MVLITLLVLGAAADVLGCDSSIQIFRHKWQDDVLHALQAQTSVALCLGEPEQINTVDGENIAGPQLPQQLVPLCEKFGRIGEDLLKSMSTDTLASLTSQYPLDLPIATRELTTQEGKGGLCHSLPVKWTHGAMSIEVFEYTTSGGPLTGYNMSLVLSRDSMDSIIVASPDHDLPEGDYYVRSYRISDHDPDQFCMDMGMPMVMYMRGFHMSTSRKKMLPCLSYYFRTWVLRDSGHFTGALGYSFLLALLTQGLSAVRAVVVKHIVAKRTRKILLVILYTVQQFMGYLIMLIAMMYSVELLFAVVVGVALGNRIFVKADPPAVRRRRPRPTDELREPLLGPSATDEQRQENASPS